VHVLIKSISKEFKYLPSSFLPVGATSAWLIVIPVVRAFSHRPNALVPDMGWEVFYVGIAGLS